MTNEDLKQYIPAIENWPQKGVSFKDISPLLSHPEVFAHIMDQFKDEMKDIDVIVGPDARGFLFGMPLAYETKKPFVMVRKPNKLPGETMFQVYELEYGTNKLEMHLNAIKENQRVAIVDDLLATGGTTEAIIKLVERQKGIVSKLLFVMELTFLDGREKLKDYPIKALVKF